MHWKNLNALELSGEFLVDELEELSHDLGELGVLSVGVVSSESAELEKSILGSFPDI